MKTVAIVLLSVLLLVSVFFNVKPDNSEVKPDNSEDIWFISFPDANTRPTYDTFHEIKQAQQLATGKGIKVGIVGKYFGYAANKDLFAGGKDFTGNEKSFEEIAEHGLWMANTLKEIAPDVEVYALNARDKNRENETRAIIEAIDWAIENDIDILTYSAEAFSAGNKEKIDKAVLKANDNGIVTTFIHYCLPENILPTGLFPGSPESYERQADLNIFHLDYNQLILMFYEDYLKSGKSIDKNTGTYPYFSNSSMSPVLAGIVAMMKEVNNDLKPEEYKRILVETSRSIEYNGYKVNHVVNAPAAISALPGIEREP